MVFQRMRWVKRPRMIITEWPLLTTIWQCLPSIFIVCENGNSKLVDIVTVANVDDEDRVGNSLLQIWKLRFGHKA